MRYIEIIPLETKLIQQAARLLAMAFFDNPLYLAVFHGIESEEKNMGHRTMSAMMLEKNIAFAFFNKGEYEDALTYFKSVLKRLGITSLQNKILIMTKFVFDLLQVILNLYVIPNKPKTMTDNRDNDIFDLNYKKVIALVYVDPVLAFPEIFGTIKKSFRFDLRKINNGYTLPLMGSAQLSWTSFSFRLSNKLLEYTQGIIDKTNPKELFAYNFFRLQHDTWSGNWDNIQDYDEPLIDKNLEIGQCWEVTTDILLRVWVKSEQGEFEAAYPFLEKLSKIADTYEFELARSYQVVMGALLFTQSRKLYDAERSLEKMELSSIKIGSDPWRLMSLGLKARIQILLKDFAGAESSLYQGEEDYKKLSLVPNYTVAYLLARFFLDIELLEESILSNNLSAVSRHRKNAHKSFKNVLKDSNKLVFYRSEILRLVGLYCWLIDKQNKAIKWWKRAIEVGEQLGIRPDLARTYMEIGKRFLEKKSKFKELNGISANEYLEKARVMFEEMDLQWDLDELDKISSFR